MNFIFSITVKPKKDHWLIALFLGVTLEGIIRYSLDTDIFNHNNKDVEDE